jgi:hypothetical protein
MADQMVGHRVPPWVPLICSQLSSPSMAPTLLYNTQCMWNFASVANGRIGFPPNPAGACRECGDWCGVMTLVSETLPALPRWWNADFYVCAECMPWQQCVGSWLLLGTCRVPPTCPATSGKRVLHVFVIPSQQPFSGSGRQVQQVLDPHVSFLTSIGGVSVQPPIP